MLNLIFSEKQGSNKGFTLIEMMVVVAIIAILAAVGIPKFMKSMDSAKSSEAVTNMSQIATALKGYYDMHGAYPTDMQGATVEEAHLSGGSAKTGISTDLPTLDISSSTAWTYQVQANASGNFCITATAVAVSASANGNAVFYVKDLSGISDTSQYDGNFYKQGLFAATAGSVTAPPLSSITNAVTCPTPATS
ncbi:MAG: prepilin-type N-terminal cleavage/methylation domain-containing protein [Nitrospirae bacterium]|nr:prepilin-type N-terminal cleavage/methylation domain-containing protein [Nitrospirota bacterium]